MPQISVIIPAYNERDIIVSTVEKITRYMTEKGFSFEIIVVDDGSKDNTEEVLAGLNNSKVKCLKNGRNRGKGFSVRRGIMEASGETLLFTDADSSIPIEEFSKINEFLKSGYDIVIGSKALKNPETKRSHHMHRRFMGRVFNFVIRLMGLTKFKDTQCGFKVFKNDVAKKVFSLQTIDGFAFDVEVLFIADKLGYKILETPVNLVSSIQSSVSLLNSSIAMLVDLTKIRINSILGAYKLEK